MGLMYCDYCHNRECPNFGTAKGEYCGIIPPYWCPDGHNKAWEESWIEYQKIKGVKDDEIKRGHGEVTE